MAEKNIKISISLNAFKIIEAVLCENCVEVRRLKERKDADYSEVKENLNDSFQLALFEAYVRSVDKLIAYKTVEFFIEGIKKSGTNIFIPDTEEIRLHNEIDNKKSGFLRNTDVALEVYSRWDAICSIYKRKISEDAYKNCDRILSFVLDLYK